MSACLRIISTSSDESQGMTELDQALEMVPKDFTRS